MTKQTKNENPTGSTNPTSTAQKGAQAGGKNAPAGGPETFESGQVNQGKSPKVEGGGNPYPPVNPERPMMAEGQGKQQAKPPIQGGNVGQQPKSGNQPSGSSVGGSSYGSNAGTSPQTGSFAGGGQDLGTTAASGAATPGLEEEEE